MAALRPVSARKTFVALMARARLRTLTERERRLLSIARQTLRRAARPAMNRPKQLGELLKTINEATSPHTLRTDREHKRQEQRARAARTLLRARFTRGRDYTESENGLLFPVRRNPRTRAKKKAARRANPEGGARIRMGKLVELRYQRDRGSKPGFYKHTFKARPTIYYRRFDNSIFIAGG